MSRPVNRVVDAVDTLEGAGFQVRRSFPIQALGHVDPFLLLDEMGPEELAPGQAKGAPDHPHRGFETVTYLLEGALRHRDSAGNSGALGPGDVQWMTAGSGVVHSEMPAPELLEHGGRVHGFQLWVNLPRRDKLIAPRYQEIPAARVPVLQKDGARIVVIAGEQAPIETRTPILYWHVTLDAGAALDEPVPAEMALFAYVVDGTGRFGADERPARRGQLVLFGGGAAVRVVADGKLSFLVAGGVPLREPIVRYGPFVMNTQREILEALDDLRSGRLGRE